MSKRDYSHDATSCRSLQPPKSLQGTENVDAVWNMIIQRFPNAAPLLCEMESVIDRAEDLLRQLKYNQEIEASNSMRESEDSEEAISISSNDDVNANTQNKNSEPENADSSIAETRNSENSICKEIDVDLRPRSVSSSSSEASLIEHLDLSVKPNAETDKKNDNNGELRSGERSPRTAKERNSLEGWEKLVDNAMRSSIDGNASHINASKIHSNLKKETNDIGDFRFKSGVDDENQSTSKTIDIKGCGDKNRPPSSERRTPLTILEEYAARCRMPIDYQFITKSNRYVIRGSLAGFSATACDQSEELAKNSLATNVLRMIAERQMENGRIGSLPDFTREEMLEIIDMGMNSPRETSQRKLYTLCLRKGESPPKYHIQQRKTSQGFSYAVTCTALGCSGAGEAVRKSVATKAAADDLYKKYSESVETQEEVNQC